MVIHSVMWRLCEENKEKHAARIKRDIESLIDQIPEIRALTVAINGIESEHAADVVLYSTFDNWQALERYQLHPEHQKVARFIGSVTVERRVVDSEQS